MTNAEKEIPKLKITAAGHKTPVDDWHKKYRELEQKEFGLWFEEAVKPDEQAEEIQRLAEDNQRLKDNQKAEIPTFENAFIHNGDAWEIWFNGKKLNLIKNVIGLTYIANLLLKPGEDVNVVDLCDAIQDSKDKGMLSDDDLVDSLKKEKMSISTMQDDGLDERGKAAAKKLIKELKETIDDDGLPVSERTAAQNEYERLMKILSTQYGKKPLNLHAPQKVNKSVKDDLDRAGKAIRRAFNRINKESPELAEYLKKTIKTGTQYNFTDIGTPWHISI